jgi:hypothetical protein
MIRRMFPQRSDFLSVAFPIEEAFDQTPGPTAGHDL